MPLDLPAPHLLFLGDITNPLDAKTAVGLRDWRPEQCVGQWRLPGCTVDLGLPDMTPDAAVAAGAKSVLIGVAPLGGALAPAWISSLVDALHSGLSIVSGLHQNLQELPALFQAAHAAQQQLIDVRVAPDNIPIASGQHRTGNRLLTVGTDCCVGKKYTALAFTRELKNRSFSATFRATGQTGIMIAGGGIPMDAVVSDFIAGAAECLSPDAVEAHWDVIEGQGSLFHPAYAAVTLGLLHGSQPDALLLCHEAGRTVIDEYEAFEIPDLKTCITRYEEAASLTNKSARVVGVSLNTSTLTAEEAKQVCAEVSGQTGLPCLDPLRDNLTPWVAALT
jgi:uncharacterized NAD-dependent epimerase/dehydratase family protein